jgi:hypothetical protein
MSKKPIKLVSLAAALAALSGAAGLVPSPAEAKVSNADTTDTFKDTRADGPQPNVFMTVGNDLLGLIVTKAADGTVLAQHYSHYSHSSHASHSSHSSHYSSRY